MNIDQIVNQKVERALGASLLRQIVLETQVEELIKQTEVLKESKNGKTDSGRPG